MPPVIRQKASPFLKCQILLHYFSFTGDVQNSSKSFRDIVLASFAACGLLLAGTLPNLIAQLKHIRRFCLSEVAGILSPRNHQGVCFFQQR